MATFSKIDKEILITAIVALIAILLISLVVYRFFSGPVAKVQNLTGGVQTETKLK